MKPKRFPTAHLRIAARLALLIYVAVARRLYVAIEQPRSSLLGSLKFFKRLLLQSNGLVDWDVVNLPEAQAKPETHGKHRRCETRVFGDLWAELDGIIRRPNAQTDESFRKLATPSAVGAASILS